MLTFHFSGADGRLVAREVLTSGMVGKEVRLEFSSDWEGLTKTAVFTAGKITRDVVDVSDIVVIPAEVLAVPMHHLYVGVYGVSQDGDVTPTIRVKGPRIEPGADPSEDEGTDPALPVWAQLQQEINELKDGITGEENSNASQNGSDGEDGFSPIATVTQTDTGAVISITDKSGTTTATITNGKDGADGEKGEKGETGANGYTPVKGEDYFTEAEIQEIAEQAAGMVDIPESATIQPLTFTGAVEATYDGSEAVSVEIPSGGSGGGGSNDTVLLEMTVDEEVDCIDIPITEEMASVINSATELRFYLHFERPTADESTGAGTLAIYERAASWNSNTFANGICTLPTANLSYVSYSNVLVICHVGNGVLHTEYAEARQNQGTTYGTQCHAFIGVTAGRSLRFLGSHVIAAGSTIKVLAQGGK